MCKGAQGGAGDAALTCVLAAEGGRTPAAVVVLCIVASHVGVLVVASAEVPFFEEDDVSGAWREWIAVLRMGVGDEES